MRAGRDDRSRHRERSACPRDRGRGGGGGVDDWRGGRRDSPAFRGTANADLVRKRPASPLLIATRVSELALRQARQVQAALTERGIQSELKTYRTTGDKRLDAPLASIGAKGLFTKELETDLASGKVDCCVHSLKDLPTEMPAGLGIVALLEREDPRDFLIVNDVVGASTLAEIPAGSRIGTSSLRRRSQLLAIRPDLEVVD